MANEIELTNLDESNFIDNASRYRNKKIYYYGPLKKITFEIYKRTPVRRTPEDRVYVISPGTQYRPDLVAYRAYGDSRYWWRIMEANNITDVYDFVAGTNIIIPNVI